MRIGRSYRQRLTVAGQQYHASSVGAPKFSTEMLVRRIVIEKCVHYVHAVQLR